MDLKLVFRKCFFITRNYSRGRVEESIHILARTTFREKPVSPFRIWSPRHLIISWFCCIYWYVGKNLVSVFWNSNTDEWASGGGWSWRSVCVCVWLGEGGGGGAGGGGRKGCSKVATLFLQVSVQVLSQIPTTHLRKFCENLGIPAFRQYRTDKPFPTL